MVDWPTVFAAGGSSAEDDSTSSFREYSVRCPIIFAACDGATTRFVIAVQRTRLPNSSFTKEATAASSTGIRSRSQAVSSCSVRGPEVMNASTASLMLPGTEHGSSNGLVAHAHPCPCAPVGLRAAAHSAFARRSTSSLMTASTLAAQPRQMRKCVLSSHWMLRLLRKHAQRRLVHGRLQILHVHVSVRCGDSFSPSRGRFRGSSVVVFRCNRSRISVCAAPLSVSGFAAWEGRVPACSSFSWVRVPRGELTQSAGSSTSRRAMAPTSATGRQSALCTQTLGRVEAAHAEAWRLPSSAPELAICFELSGTAYTSPQLSSSYSHSKPSAAPSPRSCPRGGVS